MEFAVQELRDLAEFFAKRFPAEADRERIVAAAGLKVEHLAGDPLQAWERIVRAALQEGRLWNLAEAGRIARPADANLRELASAFSTTRTSQTTRLVAAAAVAVLAVGGLAFALNQPAPLAEALDASATAQIAFEDEALAAVLPAAVSLDGAVPNAETDLPVTAPEHEIVSATPQVAPTEAPTVAPAVAMVTAPVSQQARVIPRDGVQGRCGGAKEEIVGYWYAGAAVPGTEGEIIEISRAVNVRENYPRYANGYSPREPIVCWLKEGDKVKLTNQPIFVEGDVYWVPLVAGDLVRNQGAGA